MKRCLRPSNEPPPDPARSCFPLSALSLNVSVPLTRGVDTHRYCLPGSAGGWASASAQIATTAGELWPVSCDNSRLVRCVLVVPSDATHTIVLGSQPHPIRDRACPGMGAGAGLPAITQNAMFGLCPVAHVLGVVCGRHRWASTSTNPANRAPAPLRSRHLPARSLGPCAPGCRRDDSLGSGRPTPEHRVGWGLRANPARWKWPIGPFGRAGCPASGPSVVASSSTALEIIGNQKRSYGWERVPLRTAQRRV